AQISLCVDNPVAGCAADHLFTANGITFGSAHTFSTANRRQAINSLNVYIRGPDAVRLLTAGTHTFAYTVTPHIAGSFANADGSLSGKFQTSARINIWVVP